MSGESGSAPRKHTLASSAHVPDAGDVRSRREHVVSANEIRVSAAVITDAAGRALLVRKRGTTRFMQPGGKPEAGETPAETLARELHEELGLVVDAADLRPLGEFRAAAANEPGHTVVADAFALVADPADIRPQAEIDEIRWISRDESPTIPLAPLSVEALLPLAWG